MPTPHCTRCGRPAPPGDEEALTASGWLTSERGDGLVLVCPDCQTESERDAVAVGETWDEGAGESD